MFKKILIAATILIANLSAQFSTITQFPVVPGTSYQAHPSKSDLSGIPAIVAGVTPTPSPVYTVVSSSGAILQTATLTSVYETGDKYTCDVDGDGIEDILSGDSIVTGFVYPTISWVKNLGGTSGPVILSWPVPNPIPGPLTIAYSAEIVMEGFLPGDVVAYGGATQIIPAQAYLTLSYVTQAGGFTNLSAFAQPPFPTAGLETVPRLQKTLTSGLIVNATGVATGFPPTHNYQFNYISPAGALVGTAFHTVPTDFITDFAIGDFSGDGWEDIVVLVARTAPAYDVYFHTVAPGTQTIVATNLVSRPGIPGGYRASRIVMSSSSGQWNTSVKDVTVLSTAALPVAVPPMLETTTDQFITTSLTSLVTPSQLGPVLMTTKTSKYPYQEDVFVTTGNLHWLLEPTPAAPASISNYGVEPVQGAAQGLPYIGNSNFGFAMNGGVPGMPTILGIGAVQHMPPIFVAPALNLYTTPLIWAPATVVNAYGWAGTNYAIPNNPALIGTVLYAQWFTANSLGQTIGSQGMTTIIY